MKRVFQVMCAGLSLSVLGSSVYALPGNMNEVSQIKIPFIENQGQLNSDVAYYARTFAGTIFVNKQGELIYSLPVEQSKNQGWVFSEKFLHATKVHPAGEQLSQSKINIFSGKDKASWRTNIPSYSTINLENAYPGIDVKLQAKASNMEKLFHVAPNADPSQIQLQIDGVNKLSVDANQQLVLETDAGQVKFTAPVAYQMINEEKVYVDVAYAVNALSYGFTVGKYDKSRELVIDPLLASTFLGGDNTAAISDFEDANGIVEKNGSVFVVGTTDSTNFPTTTGYTTFLGGVYDAYVAKFDASLTTLQAATYLGGTGPDTGNAIAVDDNGDVYVAGISISGGSSFPVVGGGYNANPTYGQGTYISKFSNDLSTLLISSITIGGKTNPAELLIANNSIYLSGNTNVANIPTTSDSWDATCGGDGACDPSGSFNTPKFYGYIVRMNLGLSDVLAATYLGRSGGSDIAVASNSNIYAISSADVVVNTSIIGLDANLTSSFGSVSFPYNNGINALAVNDQSVVIGGSSRDPSLPVTANAFDSGCGTDAGCDPTGSTNYLTADAFFAQYSLDLQTTQTLSYLGGVNADSISDIYFDADNTVLLIGRTSSPDFPLTNNAEDSSYSGGIDTYVARFNADMTNLLYASYLDSSDASVGATYLTSAGNLYLTGSATSAYPVTQGAYDTSYNGGDEDVYVALWDISGGNGGDPQPGDNNPPVANAGQDQSVGSRASVTLDGTQSSDPDVGDILTFEWLQTSGSKVTLKNANSMTPSFTAPEVKGRKVKKLEFTLTVTDNHGASASDVVVVTVSN